MSRGCIGDWKTCPEPDWLISHPSVTIFPKGRSHCLSRHFLVDSAQLICAPRLPGEPSPDPAGSAGCGRQGLAGRRPAAGLAPPEQDLSGERNEWACPGRRHRRSRVSRSRAAEASRAASRSRQQVAHRLALHVLHDQAHLVRLLRQRVVNLRPGRGFCPTN